MHHDLHQRRLCLTLAAVPLLASMGVRAEVINVTAAELKARKLQSSGIRLDLPALADTGSSVPIRVEIEAPSGLKLQVIEIFLPANPNTLAVKLRLVEPQTRYAFTTRLRLAGSQDAWVVATLSDGSQIGASAPTVVSSSACFDGS